jgi:hypothetical protein
MYMLLSWYIIYVLFGLCLFFLAIFDQDTIVILIQSGLTIASTIVLMRNLSWRVSIRATNHLILKSQPYYRSCDLVLVLD